MKHIRKNKNQSTMKRLQVRPVTTIDRGELDKNVFEVVMKVLYENAHRNALDLEKEIFAPSNIKLPVTESQRVWDILTSSGFISPVVGFGNAGKVELTKMGFQVMSQFGGYAKYLDSQQNSNQPQTIILPIQIQQDDEPATEEQKTIELPAPHHGRKSKYARK